MMSEPEVPPDPEAAALPLPLSTDRIEEFARRVGMLAELLPHGEVEASPDEIGAFARQLYDERRIRDGSFSGELFGEPAWDIMLHLYAAREEARRVSVASACAAAAVPPSAGLRYLNAMLKLGLITTTPAPQNGDEASVELSEVSRRRMTQLLSRMIAARQNPGEAGAAPDRHGRPHG